MNAVGRVLSHPFFLLPLALTVVSSFQQYLEAIAFLSRIVTQWNEITGWIWTRFALVVDWPFRLSIDFFRGELNLLLFAALTNLVSVFQYRNTSSLYETISGPTWAKLIGLAALSAACFLIFMPAVAAARSIFDVVNASGDWTSVAIMAGLAAFFAIGLIFINNDPDATPVSRFAVRAFFGAGLGVLICWGGLAGYSAALAELEGWTGVFEPDFWATATAADQAILRENWDWVLEAEDGIEQFLIGAAFALTMLLPPRTLRTYIQVILLAVSIIVVSYGVDFAYGLLGLEPASVETPGSDPAAG